MFEIQQCGVDINLNTLVIRKPGSLYDVGEAQRSIGGGFMVHGPRHTRHVHSARRFPEGWKLNAGVTSFEVLKLRRCVTLRGYGH